MGSVFLTGSSIAQGLIVDALGCPNGASSCQTVSCNTIINVCTTCTIRLGCHEIYPPTGDPNCNAAASNEYICTLNKSGCGWMFAMSCKSQNSYDPRSNSRASSFKQGIQGRLGIKNLSGRVSIPQPSSVQAPFIMPAIPSSAPSANPWVWLTPQLPTNNRPAAPVDSSMYRYRFLQSNASAAAPQGMFGWLADALRSLF